MIYIDAAQAGRITTVVTIVAVILLFGFYRFACELWDGLQQAHLQAAADRAEQAEIIAQQRGTSDDENAHWI